MNIAPPEPHAAPRSHGLRIRSRALLLCWCLVLPALFARPAPGGQETLVLPCRVVQSLAHDPGAFTQGLVFMNQRLYESTGKYGASSLRQLDPGTGAVLRQVDLPPDVFAEGIAPAGTNLVLLTWKSGRALLFDGETLARTGSFAFTPEGWGLAAAPDGTLWQSRGDHVLLKRDPATFLETGRVEVRDADGPVDRLNELEWVGEKLLANIWFQDRIAVIDPGTGRVEAYIDLAALRKELGPGAGVANGMALDPESGALYVTGKYWDKLFIIEY